MAEDYFNFLFEAGVEESCAKCASSVSFFPNESELQAWHNAGHEPPVGSEINESKNYEQETGFPVSATTKEAMDNPFGYGPFVSDDPLVSDQYSHDNPANNVGPYAGPASYSINTTGPYSPPGEDEENPAQNVGPYDPPSLQNERLQQTFSPAPNTRAAYRSWSAENGWFDGSSKSVYDRISEAQVMRRQASIEGDVETEYALDEQINTLYRVANELDESNLNDYMEALPGGTVAMEYDDLSDAGMVDLGSFISVESHRIFAESRNYDWEKFSSKGANEWVNQKLVNNPGLLRHETDTRRAAIDYVKNKTMVLTDPVARAGVIDDFVSQVERSRRKVVNAMLQQENEKKTKAKNEQDNLMLEIKSSLSEEQYGLSIPLDSDFVDGKLNIGENDGSLLYTAAADTLENNNLDWPNFTTEGAREWFWSQASDNEVMLNHQDITRRAARDFANERTAHVRDSALKNEIVRAFCDSVEFLRNAYAHKKAKLASIEVEDTAYQEFEEVFGNEDEILW